VGPAPEATLHDPKLVDEAQSPRAEEPIEEDLVIGNENGPDTEAGGPRQDGGSAVVVEHEDAGARAFENRDGRGLVLRDSRLDRVEAKAFGLE
jgi:hypothetical protein